MLAGCGGSQPPTDAPGAMLLSNASGSPSYQVLYSFRDRPDGGFPMASLIDVNGVLYGTTAWGGKFTTGTAFSISTTGSEQVLHSFRPRDGKRPVASLIDVNGIFYGTTKFGGTHREGAVFKMSMPGRERVLHSFDYSAGSNSDGAYPTANLISVNGTLYGTTAWGGNQASGLGDGTVFSISTNGSETVLHRFTGTDGAHPNAGLIDVNGTLYGTTDAGGKNNDGTVFSISTSGAEKVLHSFGGPDGIGPNVLIDVKGTLYGTTTVGGAYTCFTNPPISCGTVFSMSTSGAEKVLHSFGDGRSDGKEPYAGLIDAKGSLYGTTSFGGTNNDGTVFSISTSGAEKVLHNFSGGSSDGGDPEAGLRNVNGTLYSTTVGGGAHHRGTVFALTL
ncbi:MAG: choice-of-anchor tandem repeat GloVer-containing protein [Candidatus Cybelea sp.]